MKNNKVIQIAIDGPVSSGKSTVGKLVAKSLGYCVLDTGILYRAVAWKFLNNGGTDLGNIEALLKETAIEVNFYGSEALVLVNGMDVTQYLFFPEVSIMTSKVAQILEVRNIVVDYAREAAKGRNIVMVGRDIGTVVLPDASVKIFLSATPEERARRRYEEYETKGVNTTFEDVYRDLLARDKADTTRTHSPLTAAHNAYQLDTTDIGLEQVVREIVSLIQKSSNASSGKSSIV